MKKIVCVLIAFSFLFNGYSQLDSSINIFNDLRVNQWAKKSHVPSWQIDGYRAIIFNGDTLVRVNSGIFQAEEAKIYANGSNMSSPLQIAFDYSAIKWISFGSDSSRTYVFNSAVINAHGKTVKFENGNMLNGTGTIDSIKVDASDFDQIFGSSLTVTNVRGVKGYISPNWWGAKGDGATDDLVPLRKTLNQQNVTVRFPKLSYYTSDSVMLHWSNSIEMPEGSLLLFNIYGIVAGSYDDSHQVQMRGKEYSFRVERFTQSDWVDTNSVGIKLVNINYSKVKYASANKFTIGMKTIGYDAGLAYVDYVLGVFEKNMVDIWIATLSPHELAWNNQNNYYGGWFRNGSENPGKKTWGVWIGNGNYSVTNNIFQAQSIEKKPSSTAFEVISGSRNKAYDFRMEGGSDTIVYVRKSGTSNKNNYFYAGRDGGTGFMIDSSSAATNFYSSAERISFAQSNYTVVAEMDNIFEKCIYSGPDSLVNIAYPGLFIQRTGSAFPTNTIKAKVVDDYIQIDDSYLYGLTTDYIDVSKVKKLVIKQDALVGYHARIFISLFDGNYQNISATSQLKTDYTKTYTSTYGGSIGITADAEDIAVAFPAEVGKVRVIFGKASNDVRLRSYKIVSYYPGESTTYSTINNRTVTENISPSKPTIGNYRKGRVIYNSNPDNDSARGWICDASGTFGSLIGVSATMTNNTNFAVLNAGSGLKVRRFQWLNLNGYPTQIIGIANDTVFFNGRTYGTLSAADIDYAIPSFINLSGGVPGDSSTTASNYGASGVGVYDSKSANDLRFRNINAGSNKVSVALNNANHEVEVDVNTSNLTGIPQSGVSGLTDSISVHRAILTVLQQNDTLHYDFYRGVGGSKVDSLYIIFQDTTFRVYSPLSTYGEYTPILTNSTNVSSSSAGDFRWTRTGNIVHVSGKIVVTPAAGTTNTILGIAFPIPSLIPTGSGCWGGGWVSESNIYGAGQIVGDDVNDRAVFSFVSLSTSAHLVTIDFSYTVN